MPFCQYLRVFLQRDVAALDEGLQQEGPVPTGLAKNSASDLPPKFLGRIALAKTEMSERNGAHGCVSSKVTVEELVALIDLIARVEEAERAVGVRARRG